MKAQTGYLTSVVNPGMSGLARIVFRSSRKATPKTKYTTLYVESGFGVRQVVAALGTNGRLDSESAQKKVRYTSDGLLLSSLELA